MARDLDDGAERWSRDGIAGFCADGEVAVAEDDVVDILDADDGQERASIKVGASDEANVAYPLDGAVLAQSVVPFDEGGAAIYPRDGGEPTWEQEGVSALPLDEDRVIVVEPDDGEVSIVGTDGEERGEAVIDSPGNDCDGDLTADTLVVCETGETEVSSLDVGDGLDGRCADRGRAGRGRR